MSIKYILIYITTLHLVYKSVSLTINSVQIKDSAIPVKGSNIQLVCSISGFTSSTVVQWYKTDTQTIVAGERVMVKCVASTCIDAAAGYTYSADANNMYLTITDLRQTTDGKWWTCRYGTQTKALQLVVYTVPQSLVYDRVPSDSQDLSTNSVSLECKCSCAYPAPTFLWYYTETGGSRQQYSTPAAVGEETGNTCTDTEKIFTTTLTLPRYTTFTGNADKTVKLECGIPTFPGRNTALYTPFSPDITFAVKTTSVTLRDGSSQQTSSSVITVTSGSPMTLTCSPSFSRPAATLGWYIGNVEKQRSSSTSFTFTPSDNDNDKQVYCKAFNILPESQSVFSQRPKLYVQVAPEVTADLSTSSLEENSSVNIICNAAGRPATYTYTDLVQTWRDNVIPNTHSNLVGTEQHSSLALTSLQLQDTGNYTCHVNNGIKDRTGKLNQTGNVYLKVKVSPKILPVQVNFAGAPGDTVNISIPFYSYPAAVGVTFTKQGGGPIQNDNKYTVSYPPTPVLTKFYGQDVKLSGNTAILKITNMQVEDLAKYTLTINNSIGTKAHTFSLSSQSIPLPPKIFLYLGLFDGIPRFYWEEGFNGGLEQFFVIETTVIGTGNWIKHGLIVEGDQLYQQVNKAYIANITGLAPGQYSARLTAENNLGPIGVSDRPTVIFTIQETHIPSDTKGNNTAETIGAFVGGIAFAVMVIAVIFIVRRQRKLGKCTCLQVSNTDGQHEDASKDQDVYYNMASTGPSTEGINLNESDRNTDAATYETAISGNVGEHMYTDLKASPQGSNNPHTNMEMYENLKHQTSR